MEIVIASRQAETIESKYNQQRVETPYSRLRRLIPNSLQNNLILLFLFPFLSVRNCPKQAVQIVESIRTGIKVSQRIVSHVGTAYDEKDLEVLKDLYGIQTRITQEVKKIYGFMHLPIRETSFKIK